MKILFTGATGVLGKASVPVLVADGHDVTGVYRSDPEREWLDGVGARPAKVDLFNPSAVQQAMAGIDTVIHFATSIPPQSAMSKRSSWVMNDRLRSTATRYLVDAAIRNDVDRFIQQSIAFVYADGGDDWLDESATIEPVWEVLNSALDAEREVRRFRSADRTGVVLRLARLYGPGAASHDYIESVRSRSLPVIGKGANYVSSIHVADAATALAAAITAPDGVYNIGDDTPMRSGESLRALAGALSAPEPRRIPGWLASLALRGAARMLTVSHRVKNEAFKLATGWKPAYPSAAEGWMNIVGAARGD